MSNYLVTQFFIKYVKSSSCIFLTFKNHNFGSINIQKVQKFSTRDYSKFLRTPCSRVSKKMNKNKTRKFKPVTHVIFDLDGTLLGTDKVYNKILGDICRSYGKEYTDELRGKIAGSTESDTIRTILKELGLEGKVTEEQFFDEFKDEALKGLKGAPLFPGAEKLINHLHKHKIPFALATSSLQETVDIKIAHVKDLFNKFSHMVSASSDPEVKKGKPAPDIFLICASRFNPPADPEKCLVFEDAPNGVLGGLRANMQVVAILVDKRVPKNLYPENATIFINSLADFEPELFGLPPYD